MIEELPCYDDLPSYECTVYKEGYVRIKKELSVGGFMELKNRSWAIVYFKLRGTLLQMYKTKGSEETSERISMLKANCGMAHNYTKHDQVLRLCLESKEQYLIRPNDLPDTVSWFEHLQSAINISTDIDKRRMPRILTLSRGTNRHQQRRTVTLIVGKTQAIVPILKCQSQK
ncbi:hypothetical protein INT47_009154 [Mucor saturninus]|uniref:PH domain-containing protein n=1 Tax=Mucor saturninus TaxID=64648 RepID=A0A8H7RN34_9FUNG|nr:hypothetical protein INT47_009154 [Mucor saturninus]